MSILARSLVKQFGTVRAVDGVSFEIQPGEIVGLIGPNGAGKTTLLRMLATFLQPTSGTAQIAGFDGVTESLQVRRHIGYLPETLPTHPDVRVEEYLHYRARLKDIPRRQRRAEVDRCLHSCQLAAVRRRLLGRLSQGYRRRTGLADVLLHDPPVLMLDEPTIGLDPLQVVHARELLAGIAADRAILLSTHLLAEAEALCQRALVLVRGRLCSDVNLTELRNSAMIEVEVRGPPMDIEGSLEHLPNVRSILRLDSPHRADDVAAWHRYRVHCLPNADIREQVAARCAHSGWALRELSCAGHSLEDHFIRTLTAAETRPNEPFIAEIQSQSQASPPVTRHPSPVTRHPSPVTRHPPPVTRHPPPVRSTACSDSLYHRIMPAPRSKRANTATDDSLRVSQRATPGLLVQRSLAIDTARPLPEVQLRSVKQHPFLFRKMIGHVDGAAQPGDLVAVRTPQGEHFGYGLFNPRAEIAIRMLQHGGTPPGIEFWRARLEQAVQLRRDLLQLDAVTDAYRLVHAEADGLSGLVIDKLGDTLSAEAFSLAMFQRCQALLDLLAPLAGTTRTLVQVAPQAHGQEGFLAEPVRSPGLPQDVLITEFGTRFRVNFEGGHKTGFFCDQRENRRRLAEFCSGRSVLDLCCYSGGFAIQAKKLGNAAEVTGVDLDEKAIDVAQGNARLNGVKVNFVHADVFGYMRDMLQNGRQYDVVVLDPPKLIRSRRDVDEGTRKHLDLNRLALQVVRPGGLLLSCTCSGLLGEAEFLRLLQTAARQAGGVPGPDSAGSIRPGRTVQILSRTGAAADHPVSPECPETEYLKAAWMRVL